MSWSGHFTNKMSVLLLKCPYRDIFWTEMSPIGTFHCWNVPNRDILLLSYNLLLKCPDRDISVLKCPKFIPERSWKWCKLVHAPHWRNWPLWKHPNPMNWPNEAPEKIIIEVLFIVKDRFKKKHFSPAYN